MPPLQSLNKKKRNWKTEVWQKIPETFHFQRELRCLYSCPFPWKVIITFIVSPSPAEGGHMRTPFCIRKLQFHSPLSSNTFHLTMAAACLHPWPPFHGANTAHPYLWRSWEFSMKNDTKIGHKPEHFPSWACNAAPQALTLFQHQEGYKSTWNLLRQQRCCQMKKSSHLHRTPTEKEV